MKMKKKNDNMIIKAMEKAIEDHPEYSNLDPEVDEIDGINPWLHILLHKIVELQLTDENFPAREALNRLTEKGVTRHEAIHKIGAAFVEEIFPTLKKGEEFDTRKYVERLLKIR